MTIAWGKKPDEPPTLSADVVQGKTGRYSCKSVSSVDVHLCQLAKRMIACETITLMDELLEDRDLLLETRLELASGGRQTAGMPHLSDTA